ncbi:unnamed protein product [Pocillopora meandrina]|uniref:Reverse transcriptase domain-containing protein n=1 Tax=Pocillopora meandrina TaxID=46732 RepID=A0AAU9XUY7_9CNID|nr:unnamed protein product [Pocillopora meandrina]
MVRTGFSFLKLRIYEYHSSILRLRALFSRSRVRVEEFCSSKELPTFTKQREKHDRKLCHLLSKRSPVNSGSFLKDKWVMNLSSKELSALERSSLEKGLKFAIAPRKIPTAEIVAVVEDSISQLDDDRRHLVRAEVSSILRRAKPPPKNIQKDVFNALLALKKDPDRLVLSADKGNCVVVMDKQQYHDKALSLLNDKSTYAVLNSDPTSKTQRKLNKMLLNLKKAGRISDSTYKMLYSSNGLCPHFYGLPKIHKPGIPLRPIVSFVNSPTYAISGYLARILSPVFANTDYTVKNSCEFADFIRDNTLDACEELVSFDVVSLFTKIPVDLSVKVAEE